MSKLNLTHSLIVSTTGPTDDISWAGVGLGHDGLRLLVITFKGLVEIRSEQLADDGESITEDALVGLLDDLGLFDSAVGLILRSAMYKLLNSRRRGCPSQSQSCTNRRWR
jgi:hypothetical protein